MTKRYQYETTRFKISNPVSEEQCRHQKKCKDLGGVLSVKNENNLSVLGMFLF